MLLIAIALATTNTATTINGRTFRVEVRGDFVKVAQKAIFAAPSPQRRIEMRSAVQTVTGCAIVDDYWDNSALVGVLKCPAKQPFDVKADYMVLARQHCQREWPNDFQMQGYCLKEQAKGMMQFKAVSDSIGKPIEKALENCTEQWTKDRLPDWQMIGHCALEQAAAYGALTKLP